MRLVLTTVVTDERDRTCLHALFVTNPLDDMEKILDTKDKYLEGTCSWILDDSTYKEWLHDEQSHILWVHGDPGKGKTMLAISQINELTNRIKSSKVNGATLSYFFCDNKDDRRKDAVMILRGLLYQLLCQRPEAIRYLRDEYEKQKDQLFLSSTAQQSLWRILESILRQFTDSMTWFVIDALDECEPESREILLQRIINQAKVGKGSTPNNQEKWLLTSRNEPLIRESMTGCLDISLESNSKAITSDVRQFIDAKVQELGETKKYQKDLKINISRILEDKADRTFLWVSLACAELRKVPSIKAIKVLQRLPPGLNAFYEQLLSRVLQNEDEDIAVFVKEILVTVLVAVRPLKLHELAVTAGLPAEYWNDGKSIQEYAEQCGSFLTIRQQAVYFVHQSAKDFLSSANALALSTNLAEENKKLTIRCFDYICSGAFQAGEIDIASDSGTSERSLSSVEDEQEDAMSLNGPIYDNEPGLLKYPVLFWIAHARLASPDFVESQSFDADQEFFRPTSHLRDSWFGTYWSGAHRGWESTPDRFSSLHLAAYSRVLPLVIKIQLHQPHTVNWKDSQGLTALCWAAEGGHEATMRLLLEKGADVNMQDNNGMTELHGAAMYGHEAVVQLLLEKGAGVDVQDDCRMTVLHWATVNGHEAVVQLLLEKGAGVNVQDGIGRTALYEAAKNGYEVIMHLLLEKGAGVDVQDDNGMTALHEAATGGHEAMVRLLLEKGAGVDIQDIFMRTALHKAAENGHEAVVRLLTPLTPDS